MDPYKIPFPNFFRKVYEIVVQPEQDAVLDTQK